MRQRADTMNIVLDKTSRESANKKRPFSTSALMRFWLKVLVYDEDRLFDLKKTDEEFRAILGYVSPKLAALADGIKKKVKDLNQP